MTRPTTDALEDDRATIELLAKARERTRAA